jgi:protocatechuate 3,4-dioxygenase beta subunit
MKYIFTALLMFLFLWGFELEQSTKKEKLVGGGCDGCEAMYAGMPKELSWETTIADGAVRGERLIVSGKIFKRDGRTPAPNVVLYVYHTDANGLYSPALNQTHGRPHGHLRGWMKTNARGEYKFTTIRPASYPNSKNPQHIHPIIKEPDKNEYWRSIRTCTSSRKAGLRV